MIQNTWIKRDSKFLGKINKNLCSLDLNTALEEASLNANPGGIPPSAQSSPPNPPTSGSRIKSDSNGEMFFEIYPNPSSGIFNIECSKDKKINKVVISDVNTAKEIFHQEYDNTTKVEINISKEAKGLYVVKAYFEDGSSETKTIIKK